MTVAGEHQFATGAAAGAAAAGSRPSSVSRGGVAGQSDDTFRRLLLQGQTDTDETAESTTSGDSGSAGSGAGSSQESTGQKSCSPLAIPTSAESQASPRRKKGTAESDYAAPAFVAQTPEVWPGARWLLSLIGNKASSTAWSLDLDAQSSTKAAWQEMATAGSAQESKINSEPALLLEPKATSLSGAENAISGATQGTIDAAPFAELSLTPSASSAGANLVMPAKPNSPPTLSPVASSPISHQADSGASSQSQGMSEENTVAVMRLRDVDHGGESSLDQSAGRQKATFAVSKKRAETGGAQSNDSSALLDRVGIDQGEVTSPIATRPSDPQISRMSDEAPASTSPVLEPASAEPVKPSGSTVGTIELQVKVADDKSVGLRFVERQGQVTIQLKSGDVQMAHALSDNLASLKTSLNENGWDVESRVQNRLSTVSQGSQTAASAERGSSPLSQLEFSSLSARASLNPLSTSGNQQTREAADQFVSPQTLRAEQVSTGQMNHQNGSDSSSSHDQARPDRDGSSGKHGQEARNGSAGADSERQGRHSTRGSEAWLESMESNLTKSSSSRFTSGVNK